MISYKEFLDKLEESVRVIKGTRYGGAAQYDDEEDDDDDDAPKKKEEPKEKRGRGRPAGSKSGARQKGSGGKSDSGIQTHTLHLPGNK